MFECVGFLQKTLKNEQAAMYPATYRAYPVAIPREGFLFPREGRERACPGRSFQRPRWKPAGFLSGLDLRLGHDP